MSKKRNYNLGNKHTRKKYNNKNISGNRKKNIGNKRDAGNRRNISGKKRVNKFRVLLLLVFIILLVVSIFKGISGIKKRFNNSDNNQINIKTAEDIEKEKANIINIMIDPAKGGINAGPSTKNRGLSEKEINLKIAQFIREDLSKYKDVRVMLTRDYDNDKSVKDRVKLAKDNEIDIFVSIRLNAQTNNNEANGIDTFYTEPKEKPSLIEGTKDNSNKSDTEISKNIQDIEDNSTSTKQSNTTKQTNKAENSSRVNLSKELAINIQEAALSFVEMKDRGVINNSYDVLKYTEMPAVIVHCGFITNKNDEAILEDDEKVKELADGISGGILQFIDHNKKEIIKDRINYR